jgi:hypothetical protein
MLNFMIGGSFLIESILPRIVAGLPGMLNPSLRAMADNQLSFKNKAGPFTQYLAFDFEGGMRNV